VTLTLTLVGQRDCVDSEKRGSLRPFKVRIAATIISSRNVLIVPADTPARGLTG
jgi:hypothetical protein